VSPQAFEIALRDFCRRREFRPFWVELHSGSTLRVENPDMIAVRGAVVHHLGSGNIHSLFDVSSVSRLSDEPPIHLP
jgi:hypothetical protein